MIAFYTYKAKSAKIDFHNISNKQRHHLLTEFDILSGAAGDNGKADADDFFKCSEELGLGIPMAEIQRVFAEVDENGDGVMDFDEFINICRLSDDLVRLSSATFYCFL